MSDDITTSPKTDTYLSVRKLLMAICVNHVAKYGGELDEVLAEANLQYSRIYKKYKPAEAHFEQWLSFSVSRLLIEVVRKRARRNRLCGRVVVDLSHVMQEVKSQYSTFEDFCSTLTADELVIVSVVIMIERQSVRTSIKKISRTAMRLRTMTQLCEKQGWTKKRFIRAYESVKNKFITYSN